MKKLELSENLNYHIFPQAQKLRHLYRVYGWGFRLVYWVMCNYVRLRIRQTKTKQKRINLLGLGSIYRVQHDCKNFFVCSFREEMRPKKENKRWNCAKNQFFCVGTIQICSFSSYSNVNVCTCTVYYEPISVTMYLRVCQSSVQH